MYLSGVIPLSAQLGNAISNDGDALFPAIAIHPKAALIATLYSAVPAFIVSYLYLFIFEANIFWFYCGFSLFFYVVITFVAWL